jgi:hypothetical protein
MSDTQRTIEPVASKRKVCGSEFPPELDPDGICVICGFKLREHGAPTITLPPTEICPHCSGSGRVPKKEALQFPIGAKVLWTSLWWRYPEGAKGVVIGHSKSGKRVRVKYEINGHNGKPIGDGSTDYAWVTPQKLEWRV